MVEVISSPEEIKSVISKRNKEKLKMHESSTDFTAYFLVLLIIAISILTYPENWESKVEIQHVWYYGWITAIATGAGVIPFFFLTDPNKFWMGISNAVAGGMMLAASYSLTYEGFSFTDEKFGVQLQESQLNTGVGFAVGIVFIMITQKLLEKYEGLDITELNIEKSSAQKMVLIIFVMTLHSLTEGIGIGVSFGGQSGMVLGQFISLSLAVHNVPEGLAVALVMTSRKVSKVRSCLWAILTSLPQPLTAIPAYLFVEKFVPLLPAGLGFAAGAMAYVAIFELLLEAVEDSSLHVAAGVGTVACAVMMLLQQVVKVSI